MCRSEESGLPTLFFVRGKLSPFSYATFPSYQDLVLLFFSRRRRLRTMERPHSIHCQRLAQKDDGRRESLLDPLDRSAVRFLHLVQLKTAPLHFAYLSSVSDTNGKNTHGNCR